MTSPNTKSAITIGNFDGVHLGHAALISKINNFRDTCEDKGCRSVVVTFDPHPVAILRPQEAPPKLCSIDDRIKLIRDLGVDQVKVIEFNRDFSQTPAKEFFEKILIEGLNPSYICVGRNFHFGYQRTGSPQKLYEWATELGIQAEMIDPVKISKQGMISSSGIRQALASGDLDIANAMLGRRYSMTGAVVHGHKQGRRLGFPTANLSLPSDHCLPFSGVYACFARLEDGTRYQAVSNIGRKPSFGDKHPLSLETHLLDFNEELYEKSITVEFVYRLRDEMRFDGPQSLSQQIQKDILKSRQLLGSY